MRGDLEGKPILLNGRTGKNHWRHGECIPCLHSAIFLADSSLDKNSILLCIETASLSVYWHLWGRGAGQERGSKLLLSHIFLAVENLHLDLGVEGIGCFQHLSAYFNNFNHWVLSKAFIILDLGTQLHSTQDRWLITLFLSFQCFFMTNTLREFALKCQEILKTFTGE